MSKKKIIGGIVILIVVIVAAYFLFFRKDDNGMPAFDDDDAAAYDRLHTHLINTIDPAAVDGWLMDIAREYYNRVRPENDKGRLVNGSVTKTGALLSAYASSYYGNEGYIFNGNMDDINTKAYDIFYLYKRKAQGGVL